MSGKLPPTLKASPFRRATVHVFGSTQHVDRWMMAVEVDGVPQKHERTVRDYESPGDCLTSARHLVNEVTKGK